MFVHHWEFNLRSDVYKRVSVQEKMALYSKYNDSIAQTSGKILFKILTEIHFKSLHLYVFPLGLEIFV